MANSRDAAIDPPRQRQCGLRDSLYALRQDDAIVWNGLNALLRERHTGWTAQVIHETMTRSDALLEADRADRTSLPSRPLPLGPFSFEAQFRTRLFAGDSDVVVLSIQPDVMNQIVRHRADGHLFYPHDARAWSRADRQWLAEHCAPVARARSGAVDGESGRDRQAGPRAPRSPDPDLQSLAGRAVGAGPLLPRARTDAGRAHPPVQRGSRRPFARHGNIRRRCVERRRRAGATA